MQPGCDDAPFLADQHACADSLKLLCYKADLLALQAIDVNLPATNRE